MHVREPDRPFDRPTKMAGETFSRWSTQVNKDALFVTATLSSIASLFERLASTTPDRRNRPNVSDAALRDASSGFRFSVSRPVALRDTRYICVVLERNLCVTVKARRSVNF